MAPPRRLSLAALPLLPAALMLLVWLGFSAFREALAQGGGTAWLMAWVLAFLVGMPLLVLMLAVAGAMHNQRHRPWVIPDMGEKIPRTGQ